MMVLEMKLWHKIIVILFVCCLLSAGSILIIVRMFDQIEDQLLRKCRIEAQIGAQVMRTFMELMIHANLLTPEQIRDQNYVKIEGTKPQKYRTQYDAVFDRTIQKMQDEFLNDEDVIYAILIDKNGYVPTHNSKYSIPQDPDPVKNLAYSRSKRNFASNESIRNVLQYRGKGSVRYLYRRDTGEYIWNIGVPIEFRGTHWGAFLIGVSLHRIEIIKNQMIIITVTIMVIILSFTLLIILAVIPQKYLKKEEPAAPAASSGGSIGT